MEKEAGVSVLLSGNYNNFQCHRPVAPVSGHKDPWDWQNMLNTNDDEQPF